MTADNRIQADPKSRHDFVLPLKTRTGFYTNDLERSTGYTIFRDQGPR